MTQKTEDLERRLRWAARAPVFTFAGILIVGMVLHMVRPGSPLSEHVLHAGLICLMLTPVSRLLIAVAERIRRRDWLFVAMTVVVAIEIAVVLWRAALKA